MELRIHNSSRTSTHTHWNNAVIFIHYSTHILMSRPPTCDWCGAVLSRPQAGRFCNLNCASEETPFSANLPVEEQVRRRQRRDTNRYYCDKGLRPPYLTPSLDHILRPQPKLQPMTDISMLQYNTAATSHQNNYNDNSHDGTLPVSSTSTSTHPFDNLTTRFEATYVDVFSTDAEYSDAVFSSLPTGIKWGPEYSDLTNFNSK